MKKKVLMVLLAATLSVSMIAGCGSKSDSNADTTKTESKQDSDQEAADKVAKLIDDIYVQERTDKTDEQCTAAKEAWDALTDAQKELVEGENADPDYFGRDTGDASKDDPLNADEIGENEILVVSFGTSFNDSRATDIGGIEKAVQAAYPDWSVRRAFTAQIIINHVQARDGEKIDNVDQALQRAVDNGVKNLVVQPTHLMHGAEYDELTAALEGYKDKFESVKIAEPLLGEVGADATVINADKAAVAEAITAEAVKDAGFDSLDAVKEDGTAVEDGEITVDIPEEGKIVLVIKDGKIAEFKEYMDEKPEETPETETKTPDEFSQRLTALESSLSEIKTMLSKQTKTPPVATRTVGGKPKTDAQKTQLSNEEARKKAREAMVKFAKEK